MKCLSCSAPVPEGGRFCMSCGAALSAGSESPTIISAPATAAVLTPPGRRSLTSSDALDEGRFTAGTVLAGRYRIIGLLGRGGMGEVYRAEDLKLAQVIALKFLPDALAGDADRLARFHGEVRIARQISHPSVCRVYDIGEIDGLHYISMEYVDGEDLGSLLRRIGRFPSDKGIEIARQLCAGLSVAHEKGVIHRDLKPANVMIDGRGKVRITDFGLASLAGGVTGVEVRAGTPAYMSPEQLRGQGVTVRSDLYSLGLILYEMFTGHPASKAETRAELLRVREEGTLATPSTHVPQLDEGVERVILRCLEKDPSLRPASALAVAAALPGGDPLAEALAAGETPSPQMVAAAGETGGLKPAVAWICLGAVVAIQIAMVLLSSPLQMLDRPVLDKTPDVLEDRAIQVIHALGIEFPEADTATGFDAHEAYLRHIQENDPSPDRWDRLGTERPGPVSFWYRQSPRNMIARPGFAVVKPDDPAPSVPGMVQIRLDARGRLIGLEARPPQVDGEKGPWADPDWAALFAEADLDPAGFNRTEPRWTPPMSSDVRAAWEGTFPGQPDTPVRIEAAGFHGKPVYFAILGPWDRPFPIEEEEAGLGERIVENGNLILYAGALIVAVLLARRNVRMGRGDTAGAFKVTLVFLAVHIVVWACWAHHVGRPSQEWEIFRLDTGHTLSLVAALWLFYVGLEPLVRRRWPDTLISWNRVLAGRLRDPLVGRDVLIGCLLGTLVILLVRIADSVPAWLGWPPARPNIGDLSDLRSLTWSLARILDVPIHAMVDVMQLLFILLLLRILLRRQWIAAIVFVALFATLFTLDSDYPSIDLPIGVMIVGAVTVALVRFGLVAGGVGATLFNLLNDSIQTTAFTAWYGLGSLLALMTCLAIAFYGFHGSLAGRPAFGGGLLED